MGETDAPALVLLPGMDGTGKLFGPFVAALPPGLEPQVVAYPTDKPLSLPDYADIVARRLPPGRRIMLLAESFSGLVALTLLGRQPANIACVVFLASFAEPPRPFLLRFAPLLRYAGPLMRSAPAFMLRQFCLGSNASAEQLNWLRQTLAGVSPAVLAHRLQLVAARHPLLHAHFATPCYYLQAEDDRLVPQAATRWFEKHFDGFELRRIKGPHFLLQTEPLACAKEVADIARTVAARKIM